MQAVVTLLEAWFKKTARPLPWRKTHDPYSIWISEIMLQQTQVQTVIPYYEKFLSRFPTLDSLADAPESEVLHLWSGLGYYSRARNLQKGANYIAHELKGYFPRSVEEILKVPGIGPYTAGAVLSIAFNKKVPLVDGNVMRVFARYYGIRKPIEEKKTINLFWKLAQDWVSASKNARVLNQALMELGATICTKANPLCTLCPIQADCIAKEKNWTAALPKRRPRKKPVDLFWIKILYEQNDKILLSQNPKGEWWEALWDFPKQEYKSRKEVSFALEELRTKHGPKTVILLNSQKHTVTHHKLHVYPVVIKKKSNNLLKCGQYFPREKIEKLPLSALAKKIISSTH